MDKTTILIVDDNPTNLGVLLEYLEESGLEISVARSGEGALQQLAHFHPDLILLDIVMPEMDGFEICRQLKANKVTREIPVIFMSALSETVDKVKGFEVGGVDYVTKPFQQEEVLARIQAHLTIRRQQQHIQAQKALLEEKNEQLSELDAMKDKFFSIISYNLRSPFLNLLGLTEFIIKNIEYCSQGEIKEVTEKLRKSIENLYELLKNLLTWSTIQRGSIAHHPKQTHVQEIVARNITLLRPDAEQKLILLRNLITEKTTVYADADMLHTILRNLILNALKFTQNRGKVEISATEEKRFVEIAVADTGIGIPEEDLPNLFRIDTRYQKKGTAGEEGTGLGLILCKELVEKNGGKIWIESKIGSGTICRFTLPKMPN
jgi:signal transduction histidine kinase